MNRSVWKFLAALIIVLMAVVAVSDLDGLPRSLKNRIDAERKALASSQSRFHAAQDEVLSDLQTQSDLFHGIGSAQQWPDQLSQSLGDLDYASRDMDQLDQIRRQDRGSQQQQAETLLAQEHDLRTKALDSAVAIQKQAAHWVDLKQHLPDAVTAMDHDDQSVASFDLSSLAALVQHTETDWPDKKADLDARLAALQKEVADSQAAWQKSADARREAAAGDTAHVDYPLLFGTADELKTTAADLAAKSAEIKALSTQLYDSWDKLLVDMEVRGHFSGKTWDQKVRTVTTHYPDATMRDGKTTSDEKWVDVSQATYNSEKNDLGMAIEHKAAGKYDSEAERVAQPAGFAYVAPLSVGRNQYGYWDHSGGHDFWVFYGQYALLRDLLFNHDYHPLDRYEWEGYRDSWSTGRTYYGRDPNYGDAPRYGTQGTSTQSRYSGSTFAKSGGFKDSKYASKAGSYRDSRFASPNAGDPNADHSPHRFGSGSSPAPRSFSRPSPRPSYRPPSGARRFGRH
ncbi:MAG TPA: hypothetical protein VME43_16475 [Bryobacteraceae bacterium]|nr:hypothetical protein [Bryobacteraceae bacterium]